MKKVAQVEHRLGARHNRGGGRNGQGNFNRDQNPKRDSGQCDNTYNKMEEQFSRMIDDKIQDCFNKLFTGDDDSNYEESPKD